ncbi:unnamed protein product [Cuscuta epithymum]|uniref:Uncharacterized protein n=1 Tax=Cuscuta epithymum TaxID=186058 RepID=A0AAV0G8Q4_9ASTE|nr:unnamed protein product [Cuscuta epithymum]CAH9143569.1 unnamed protein product [Cuscuta epithymum]
MDEIASFWNYHEMQQDMEELKHVLLETSLELERLRGEASEEMRRNKEYTKQLIQLLKITCKERDEAREQLQKLLGGTGMMTPSESNVSSSVESFPEAAVVSSPAQLLLQYCNSNNYVSGNGETMGEMERLLKGKPLPQKGKLLQAVLDAGPLLQTVMVAGPLPRWRNPPQAKPFLIPPVNVKGIETENTTFRPQNSPSYPCYFETSCGNSEMFSSAVHYPRMVPPGHYGHLGKRQRLQ